MTLEEYKRKIEEKIKCRIDENHPLKPEPVGPRPFGWHPISFKKALSFARSEAKEKLIWYCFIYEKNYVFFIAEKPPSWIPSEYGACAYDDAYFYVNWLTGSHGFFHWSFMRALMAEAKKKIVWIDISKEELFFSDPELRVLKNRLLSVELMEEDAQKEKQTQNTQDLLGTRTGGD